MGRVKDLAVRAVGKLAAALGYEMIGIGVLPPAGPEMPTASLSMPDGVKLLSMRVWTESKKCGHDYRKVRPMNSHKNAVAATGQIKHFDYTCSQCTCRMCVSEWGA